MATTSTYQVGPDALSPNQKMEVKASNGGVCQATTTLREDAASAVIPVASIDGFRTGDTVTVGGTTASVLSINPDNLTMTLSESVTKSEGTSVEIVKNWKKDGVYLDEDLNINKKNSPNDPDITMTGKFGDTASDNWIVCINSRGLITLYYNNKAINTNLDLVLKNNRTNEATKIVISPGGSSEITAIGSSL